MKWKRKSREMLTRRLNGPAAAFWVSRRLVATALLLSMSVAHGAAEDGRPREQRLADEIANLRALPHGFAAWCDRGDLRMGSKRGGRFLVRGAAVCEGVADGWLVCTADPEREAQPDGEPAPHCYSLKPPRRDPAT